MVSGTSDQKTSLPNMALRESKGEAISAAGIVTAGADASTENPSVSRNFSMEGGRISQILYLVGKKDCGVYANHKIESSMQD